MFNSFFAIIGSFFLCFVHFISKKVTIHGWALVNTAFSNTVEENSKLAKFWFVNFKLYNFLIYFFILYFPASAILSSSESDVIYAFHLGHQVACHLHILPKIDLGLFSYLALKLQFSQLWLDIKNSPEKNCNFKLLAKKCSNTPQKTLADLQIARYYLWVLNVFFDRSLLIIRQKLIYWHKILLMEDSFTGTVQLSKLLKPQKVFNS